MRYLSLFVFILLNSCLAVQGQSLFQNKNIQSVQLNEQRNTPSQIILAESSPLKNLESKSAIVELFDINGNELVLKNKTYISKDVAIEKFERYINNIKVAHGTYTVLIKADQIESIHAEHYLDQHINSVKRLSEEDALKSVLPQLGSELFAWESTANLMTQFPRNSINYQKLATALALDQPKGEVVYVKDYYAQDESLSLAYMFTIESVIPEFRDRVYVSAEDGRILLRDPQMKHGIGDTRYSGTRSFPTTQIATPTDTLFELKGVESISGVLCETRSLRGLGGLPISSPAIAALSDSIADGDAVYICPFDTLLFNPEIADDIWNASEHRKVPFDTSTFNCCPTYIPNTCDEVKNDDIALDAHWGAATVARYWKIIHNRFSYDNAGAPINSYVHHGLSYENASWNGMIMKYGDGAYQDGNNPAAMFGPLVSLDVCAHEIGHAICTSTSDLVYVGESGAMNEGLSDIWAAAIEGYVLDSIDGTLDYLIWGIGEQIDQRDTGEFNSPEGRAIRWMDHPPAENNPDTYGAGTWWQNPDCASPSVANDFCGVHFNSGVLNKWFYLLTEGSGQALSPGLNKPNFDDQINDKGHTYSVTGIGLRSAEKIIYGANLLLHPNSKFADMRAASIDIARSLFGPCSNEFEQTIRAWYGVGVGPDFGSCIPTIEFNQFNPRETLETSLMDGCTASKEINFSLFSYMTNTTITFSTQGNAVYGEDYELCVTTMDFNGSEEKQLKLLIFDDKIEESNDTIIINFSGGGYSDSDTLIIINDDGIPAIGSLDTLFLETFDINDNSWQQELVNPTSLLNEWYIDAGNTNQAHISYALSSNVPTYFQLVESHIRLKSPIISGIGRKNIEVSFEYQVGGERDLVDSTALFDFGSFEISYDGFSWEEIDVFVGNAQSGAIIPDSGVYTITLPQLDNSTFYLGYTWLNDALNGTAISFIIDNVIVTGEGLEIASDVGDMMEANVPKDETIAFISTIDEEVIGILKEAKDIIGCTILSIVENDSINDMNTSICLNRSSKVFNFSTEFYTDSLLMKLYFKESEIDDWNDFNALNILTVEHTDIDNDTASFTIIDNANIIIEDHTNNGNGFVTYEFWVNSSVKSIALTDRPSFPQNVWVMNSTDNDPFSFRYWVEEACPFDTIRFDVATDHQDINLTSGSIVINKNLYIIGNGIDKTHVHNENNLALEIDFPFEVFLTKMKITSLNNANAIENRGVINVSDTISIGKQ